MFRLVMNISTVIYQFKYLQIHKEDEHECYSLQYKYWILFMAFVESE